MGRKLRTGADIVWTLLAGAIAACLFSTLWLFVGLAVVNFPLGLIFGRFPHWLLIADAVVCCVVYAIVSIVGICLAPIARAFSGR